MSKLIVNCETNEITERELNAEEIAQQQIDAAAFEIIRNEEADKANAKAALLERLGITADEAALLLS
jgi:hypothetical protein